ncbi:MAG: leucyl/phenylalanyl-tRNA--protein transferase [Desulfonatronovibrio sp. MSAO_Bac4]|nr:MAG: leucyl/phenylalanyl-tRNA--protein transferase [Desulfonatronovibrio sp. MSAO_Bac4]
MSVFVLTREPAFPHPSLADTDGLLAIGGDLSEKRLIQAYSLGIFPWYGPGTPILWWSPEPRLILYHSQLHIPRSLRRTLNSGKFRISADTAFKEVVELCSRVSRPGGHGTWILPEMIDAYVKLHDSGFAHSFEVWVESELVGGIYGVAIGKAFFGESMFYLKPDASKVALIHLSNYLEEHSFHFMDCQQTTRHMLRFGAREISRDKFLKELEPAVAEKDAPGLWKYSA